MKRIAVFEDTKCPYARLEEKVGCHKDETGKLIFDLEQTIYCDKEGYTTRPCSKKKCPLPELPKKKELNGCGGDFDEYFSGYNACLDDIEGITT